MADIWPHRCGGRLHCRYGKLFFLWLIKKTWSIINPVQLQGFRKVCWPVLTFISKRLTMLVLFKLLVLMIQGTVLYIIQTLTAYGIVYGFKNVSDWYHQLTLRWVYFARASFIPRRIHCWILFNNDKTKLLHFIKGHLSWSFYFLLLKEYYEIFSSWHLDRLLS